MSTAKCLFAATALRAARDRSPEEGERQGCLTPVSSEYNHLVRMTARPLNAAEHRPFDPLFRNPHLQTIAGHYWKRPATDAWPVERRLFRTEPEVQVLVQSQRPEGCARGDLVMVHGLEGSADAGYMRSLSAAALAAG